jgi:hypothetical protein
MHAWTWNDRVRVSFENAGAGSECAGAAFEIAVTGNENARVLFLRAGVEATYAEVECDVDLPLI